MFSRLPLYAFLLATTLTVFSAAQIQPGPFPGAHVGLNRGSVQSVGLSGAFRGMDNQPIANARVELHDIATGSTVTSGYTRPDGSFEFRNLPPGTYEVVGVQGIQETRERVDMSMGDNTVELRLRGAEEASSSSHGSISVAELKVPGKARSALRAAQKNLDKNQFDNARKDLDKALDVYPQYAAALTLRGIISMQEKKLPEARADLEKAIECDANSGMTYVALATLDNSEGRYDDALRLLDRSAALLPGSWQAQFEMARSFLGKGDFEAALKHISRAENLTPKPYGPIYLVKAHALLGLKSYGEAITQFEQYLATEPKGAGAMQARQELDAVKAFTARSQR